MPDVTRLVSAKLEAKTEEGGRVKRNWFSLGVRRQIDNVIPSVYLFMQIKDLVKGSQVESRK